KKWAKLSGMGLEPMTHSSPHIVLNHYASHCSSHLYQPRGACGFINRTTGAFGFVVFCLKGALGFMTAARAAIGYIKTKRGAFGFGYNGLEVFIFVVFTRKGVSSFCKDNLAFLSIISGTITEIPPANSRCYLSSHHLLHAITTLRHTTISSSPPRHFYPPSEHPPTTTTDPPWLSPSSQPHHLTLVSPHHRDYLSRQPPQPPSSPPITITTPPSPLQQPPLSAKGRQPPQPPSSPPHHHHHATIPTAAATSISQGVRVVLLTAPRIDAFSSPALFPWHTGKSVSRDVIPMSSEFIPEHYATLVAYPAPFHKCLFCAEVNLLSFIRTADPTKVRIGKRQRDEDELKLLETTVGHVFLFLPVAPDHSSGDLEASVDKLFDEGGSGEQSEQGDSASGGHGVSIDVVAETIVEDVAPTQLKRQKKQKTKVADAGEPSHFAKKLRDDYGAPGGPTVGGVNIAEAEVDSVFRTSMLIITGATTTTPTADLAAIAKEKLVGSFLFGADSPFADESHLIPGGFSDCTGSDFLIGGIRTVIDPNSNLQKVYALQWNFFTFVREMEHEQLFTEFNVEAARQMSLSAEVRMRAEYNIREMRRLNSIVEEKDALLKAKDEEIRSLKAQLVLKEAEAAEAIRLRAEASNFQAVEKSLQSEVAALKERNNLLETEKSGVDVTVADLAALVKVREEEVADLDAVVTSVHKLKSSSAKLQEKVTAYENCLSQLEKFQDDRIREMNDKFDKLDTDTCKDYAKNRQKPVKTGNIGHKIRSLHQKRINGHFSTTIKQIKPNVKRLKVQDRLIDITNKFSISHLTSDKLGLPVYNNQAPDTDLVEMALHLEERFYPHLLTTISERQWLLTHGLEVAIAKCLNSTEYLSTLGAAIGKAVEKGMQDGLSAGITHCAEELKSNKDASIDTIMNLLRLEDNLAEKLGLTKSKPHVDQLMVPIHHSPDQRVVGASALSLSLDVSSYRVRKIKENIAKHRSALRDVFVPLSEPFSITALTGTESTLNVIPVTVDTTTALSVTPVSASLIPLISTDDYEVAHAEGRDSAGVDVNPFPNVRGSCIPSRPLSLYAYFPSAFVTSYGSSHLGPSFSVSSTRLASLLRSKLISRASLFPTRSTSDVLSVGMPISAEMIASFPCVNENGCMHTRFKSYPNNSTTTIPRHSNRKRVPNIFEPEIRTIEEVVLMADRTIEELLQAPMEGYGEAIVISHTHISNFKRMTSTLKCKNVPNDAIKLMLFSYSLEGAARIWYEKEAPNSILTWDDLVNKFVNQFFPPSKTTHLKNEIF
nr:reverse transcriptase domain-containing protein [Tanacetum cinerariifolium]